MCDFPFCPPRVLRGKFLDHDNADIGTECGGLLFVGRLYYQTESRTHYFIWGMAYGLSLGKD